MSTLDQSAARFDAAAQAHHDALQRLLDRVKTANDEIAHEKARADAAEADAANARDALSGYLESATASIDALVPPPSADPAPAPVADAPAAQ